MLEPVLKIIESFWHESIGTGFLPQLAALTGLVCSVECIALCRHFLTLGVP